MALDPRKVRKLILEQSKRAGVGHIGSGLSIVELVCAVFEAGNGIATNDPDRDRFVLSKGHAVLALYAALHLDGKLSHDQLNSFAGDNSALGMHPEAALAGIDFCTGSLGQGLTYGVGAALAARHQGSNRRAFVILSDAEMNEGSVWEATLFAAHHQLGNLCALVDVNKQQALGATKEILNTEPLAEKWLAFGWQVAEVDGHDLTALTHAAQTKTEKPQIILADTTFGKGVSYMERQVKWHYWPMNDDEFQQALREVTG